MAFSLNLPINGVSFGQVSTLFMRELFRRDSFSYIPLFPIGDKIDFRSQPEESDPSLPKDFIKWLVRNNEISLTEHSRDRPTFKLWHLSGGLDSFSKVHNLITFYELDEPTETELSVAKNVDNLLVTNSYCKEVLESKGVKSKVIPLAFDNYNFKRIEKKYFDDDRITFNLCGKFEHRKRHEKIIKAWVSKYGNNPKYNLQCAIYNPFMDENSNKQMFSNCLNGNSYFNVNFLGHMVQNVLYNDFLNSGDIIIGMSGAEGWGLPEFQSVAIGKHAVIHNCTGYKEWATEKNCTLVEPKGKIPAYDNIFFKKGQPFNQGNIFDFDDDDFISGCEEAIKKVENNRLNEEGINLQKDFTASRMVDGILSVLK